MIEIANKPIIKRVDNFNQIVIEFFYPIEALDEHIVKNALLQRVILEKTQQYPTPVLLEKAKWDNYVINFSVRGLDFKNNYGLCFEVEIPDKNFNYDEQKTLDFIIDSIYHPYVKDGGFDEFELTKAKNELKLSIEAGFKNVNSYANIRTNEILDDDNFFKPLYKFKDKIAEVTKEELYAYYHELIETKRPLVLFFGNVSEKMEQILNNYFYNKFESNAIDDNYFYLFKFYKTKVVEEQKDFKQSIVNMIYKASNYQSDDMIKLLAIKMILNSQATHLLLEELRDKKQLVYATSSDTRVYNGLLLINAKIKADKKDLTIATIKDVILKLQDVAYVKEALLKIVEYDKVGLEIDKDSLTSMYNDFSNACLNQFKSAEETHEALVQLKAEELCAFVKDLQLDTIYFLEGVGND